MPAGMRALGGGLLLARRLLRVLRLTYRVLPGRDLGVLIGDYKSDGGYLGLPFRTLRVAEEQGLWLAAPEIVRFSHGALSSAKTYRTSFIPRLHDLCLVLKRNADLKRRSA